MSDVQNFTITTYDEKHAPPSQPILDVSLVGDCLHLSIVEYDETYETSTLKRIGQIAIHHGKFARLVNALYEAQLDDEHELNPENLVAQQNA
jgi:hypothetical protein